jgi:hypothetical protein
MGKSFDLNAAIEQRRNSVPQKSYLWRVALPSLNQISITTNQSTAETKHYLRRQVDADNLNSLLRKLPNSDIIDPRIVNIEVPFVSFEVQKENHQNSYWYYAGKNDIGSIQMTIHEHEDGQTFEYLSGWLRMMKRDISGYTTTDPAGLNALSNGVYYPPVFYKRDIYVYRLDTTKQTITQDRYKDYFISSIGELSSDYSSTDIMGYNVTFSGDSVEHTLIDSVYVNGLPPDEQQILAQKIKISPSFGGLGKDDWTRIAQSAFGDLLPHI